MYLLFIAVAPAVALLLFFYTRDRREKEPAGMLFKAFVLGALSIIPAFLIETAAKADFNPADEFSRLLSAGYSAFIVAGLIEEGLKFFIFYFFFWRNREFNEMFDGIVYSVFIALGFATLENILYAVSGGTGVAVMRALTAVPAHALFGASMGYYFGLARFTGFQRKNAFLAAAFFTPVILHGIYDFILLSQNMVILLTFIPYMIFLWIRALRQMRRLSDWQR